jgi:1-acyl-sn-glycerol-3-phosphate acyltransferase
MNIIWTLTYAGFVVLSLLTILVEYIPLAVLKLFASKKILDTYVIKTTSRWGRSVLKVAGARMHVSGLENIPDCDRLCFISNHQSMFDIPVVLGHLPPNIGFIAKQELRKIPIVHRWMKELGCILIDRKNPRQARRTIIEGIKQIRNGKPLCIFPEGTRSRSNQMADFKKGSLKLAIKSEAMIIPLTISGTYKLYEETGHIKKADVYLTVHPAIDVRTCDEETLSSLAEIVQKQIQSAL